MATKSDDRKVKAFLAKAKTREDRAYAAQVAGIKKAIAGASFFAWELGELERLAFAAYGRTKLGRHPQ